MTCVWSEVAERLDELGYPHISDSARNNIVARVDPADIEVIVLTVAAISGVYPSTIRGVSRKKPAVNARWVAMWLIRERMQMSFPLIGDEFGFRDHTSVLYAHGMICKMLNGDDKKRSANEIATLKLLADCVEALDLNKPDGA